MRSPSALALDRREGVARAAGIARVLGDGGGDRPAGRHVVHQRRHASTASSARRAAAARVLAKRSRRWSASGRRHSARASWRRRSCLPFVAIRVVSGDRQSGALLIELQHPSSSFTRVGIKAAVLLAGWLDRVGGAAGGRAVVDQLWRRRVSPRNSRRVAGRPPAERRPDDRARRRGGGDRPSIRRPPRSSRSTVTVGTWMVNFAAAVNGGWWEQAAALHADRDGRGVSTRPVARQRRPRRDRADRRRAWASRRSGCGWAIASAGGCAARWRSPRDRCVAVAGASPRSTRAGTRPRTGRTRSRAPTKLRSQPIDAAAAHRSAPGAAGSAPFRSRASQSLRKLRRVAATAAASTTCRRRRSACSSRPPITTARSGTSSKTAST